MDLIYYGHKIIVSTVSFIVWELTVNGAKLGEIALVQAKSSRLSVFI